MGSRAGRREENATKLSDKNVYATKTFIYPVSWAHSYTLPVLSFYSTIILTWVLVDHP
jgi:hypothetical protein